MERKKEGTCMLKGPRENHALWGGLFSNSLNPKNSDFEEIKVADFFRLE